MPFRKDKTGCYVPIGDFEKIRSSFETKNLMKLRKQRLGFWGWQKEPDMLKHWKKVSDTEVRIPIGYYGFSPEKFETLSEFPVVRFPELNGTLTDRQIETSDSALSKPTGLVHMSTGLGKTFIVAGMMRSIERKTLVVCDSISRMGQMRDDLNEILGVKFRTLSGSKKKQDGCDERCVIANVDSAVKQSREWIESFGCVLIDECDRTLQSEARRNWVGSLSPERLYGLTGTVKLNHVEDRVFPMFLGPKTEYLEKNFSPRIHTVRTDFEYSGGQLDDMKDFHVLKSELYSDSKRNALIVKTVTETLGDRKGIVFCEYVEHAKFLRSEFTDKGIKTFFIIGEVSGEDRESVRRAMTEWQGPCVLIGSKACIGRGFNVPELSVGYLCVTEKFTSSIEQYVGRIIRKFPGKTQCDWYDFTDPNVSVLNGQAVNRMRTYKREFPGCQVTTSFQEDFLTL